MKPERLPGMERFEVIEYSRPYIRQHVREMLAGFAQRQRLRAEARKLKRQPKPEASAPAEQVGLFTMSNDHAEQIKIHWRASFEQPVKGPLNPAGLRMGGAIEVELRLSSGSWKAYRPRTKNEFPITAQPRASSLKRQITPLFAKQLTPWTPYDQFDKELTPEQWYMDDQEKAWRKTVQA